METLTKNQAYEIYKTEMKKANKKPVTVKSFERYLSKGLLPSKKEMGRRWIKRSDLNNFITTDKISSKKSDLKLSEKVQTDRIIWDEICKQLLREKSETKKTPSMIQKALDCITNSNVKRLLEEYITALESGKTSNIKNWKWGN